MERMWDKDFREWGAEGGLCGFDGGIKRRL
jgi:hypothetical protein